jgi:hypothetical protein
MTAPPPLTPVPSTTPAPVSAVPSTGPIQTADNSTTERDARGIAVLSDPAVVPAGYNGTPATGVGGPLVDPATGEAVNPTDTAHPPCTREVTDNCVQTYERGRSPQ